MRTIQLIINILLLLAMLLCMFSGILASQYIFSIGSGKMIELGRHLHLVSTAWAFVFMSFHLGLHWSTFSAISKRIKADEKKKKTAHIICLVFVIVLFAYGVYQFSDRRFWEELFHLIDYQKEYDYSKTILPYFVESASLSVSFIAIAHYGKKLLIGRSRRRKCKDEKN